MPSEIIVSSRKILDNTHGTPDVSCWLKRTSFVVNRMFFPGDGCGRMRRREESFVGAFLTSTTSSRFMFIVKGRTMKLSDFCDEYWAPFEPLQVLCFVKLRLIFCCQRG